MFNIGNKKIRIVLLAVVLIAICSMVTILVFGINNSLSKEEEKRIAELQESCPKYFELQKNDKLYVYVGRMSPNSFDCFLSDEILSDDVKIIQYQTQNGLKLLSIDDIELLIKYFGCNNDQIIIIPYKSLISSCFYQIDDEFISEIDKAFDNKYNINH